MTKRDYFNRILAYAKEEDKEFIEHELELLAKKNSYKSTKPTKTQIENDSFKADILTAMAEVDKPVTIKELCEVCPSIASLSNQRITHMLTDLRKDGKVAREYVKKVPYFALGSEVVGE
jgi:hypothetical protein